MDEVYHTLLKRVSYVIHKNLTVSLYIINKKKRKIILISKLHT